MTYDKQTRQFYGDLVKEDGKSKRIYNEAGYLEFGAAGTAPVYYFHLKDYLGSTRAVIDMYGNQIQGTDYYTGGMPIAPYGSPMGSEEGLHTGKEFNAFSGLALYDNAARGYDPITHRFLQQDPLAEKYPHLSPYTSCANNPLRFIDPTGMDIWEVDENGNVINHIKDNTQDAFFRVGSDGKRIEGDGNSATFKYGTMKERNQKVSVKRDGKTTEKIIQIFEIAGDENASKAFDVLIGGDGENKIEWGHVKIGTAESGKNLVGTSNSESSSPMGSYALTCGYTIRESNHNHPDGDTTPSLSDTKNAGDISKKFSNATFNIFGKPNTPIPFNKDSPRIVPSTVGAKTGKLFIP